MSEVVACTADGIRSVSHTLWKLHTARVDLLWPVTCPRSGQGGRWKCTTQQTTTRVLTIGDGWLEAFIPIHCSLISNENQPVIIGCQSIEASLVKKKKEANTVTSNVCTEAQARQLSLWIQPLRQRTTWTSNTVLSLWFEYDAVRIQQLLWHCELRSVETTSVSCWAESTKKDCPLFGDFHCVKSDWRSLVYCISSLFDCLSGCVISDWFNVCDLLLVLNHSAEDLVSLFLMLHKHLCISQRTRRMKFVVTSTTWLQTHSNNNNSFHAAPRKHWSIPTLKQ